MQSSQATDVLFGMCPCAAAGCIHGAQPAARLPGQLGALGVLLLAAVHLVPNLLPNMLSKTCCKENAHLPADLSSVASIKCKPSTSAFDSILPGTFAGCGSQFLLSSVWRPASTSTRHYRVGPVAAWVRTTACADRCTSYLPVGNQVPRLQSRSQHIAAQGLFVSAAQQMSRTVAGPKPRESNLPRPEVPVGASGEVARVLGAATHYEVLEVAHDAGVQTAQFRHANEVGCSQPSSMGLA